MLTFEGPDRPKIGCETYRKNDENNKPKFICKKSQNGPRKAPQKGTKIIKMTDKKTLKPEVM